MGNRYFKQISRQRAIADRLTPVALSALAISILAVATMFGSTGTAMAQENDECLMCHEDPDLTGTRDGKEIKVHVDAALYAGSVHAGMDCVACHQDLAGAELPHEEDVEPVECGMCHDTQAEQHAISLHGQAAARGEELAPGCADCHGAHDILSHTDPDSPTAVMNIPRLCGRCHHEGTPVSLDFNIPQDRIFENYSQSIHGEGLYRKGLTVSAVCTSCHTSHEILPHTDKRSSIHADNVGKTCEKCHGQIEQVHRAVIEGHLWREQPEKIPVCVDCHSPHRIRNVFYPAGLANGDCLGCHSDPALAMQREDETVSLHVDPEAYAASAHAETGCAQCHTDVTPSLVRACETIQSPVDCGVCHAQPVEDYNASSHGRLHQEGDTDAPTCQDCHEKHRTLRKEDDRSPTFARNVPELCGECHRAGHQAAVRIESDVADVVNSYMDSIHGKGLVESGLLVTATCADCHGPHSELPASDPRSLVNEANVGKTCGTCHHGIEETFNQSIHALARGTTDKELPTCEDCHSSHTISRTDRQDFRMSMMDQCGRCHEEQATTFFDTFHGKVSRLGASRTAKCYDCHGTHDIQPPSNPASKLSRANVVETCGQCHAGSHRQFAGYLSHATHHDQETYPWLFWSFWLMTVLLVGTLSFALLHTLAWLVRLWLTRDQWRAHKELARTNKKKLFRRFDRYQRTLHIVMMISFFTLALTGMALKFSYAAWAKWISRMLGGFESMGVLHRLGAIALVIVFITHLVMVFRRKRRLGESWGAVLSGQNSIVFNLRDITEAIQSIRWFFGLGERPRYGRYTYWEKFDYFAVFWGVLVIGSTGLVLWFPEIFTYVLPGWSINVATIIHSDEALLAVAFIFTIHFFNTHFRPDKFPMDPVIFTGRVTLDELKYDKPREYEDLVARGELEDHLVEPFPEQVERGLKVFGFVALAVGLSLIGLIIYAMLFSYR